MKLNEVRKEFLDLMKENGHAVIPSAPIVPQDDATTLFTSSGMQPLVPYLLGKEHSKGNRLADSQKCFRANDIDEVGDNRHTTFFEMLGNWSLGDYFKEFQIRQCFVFLTEKLGLDPNRLYVTVFSGCDEYGIPEDKESIEIWEKVFSEAGIDAKVAYIGSQEEGDSRGMKDGERIFLYNEEKNWWSRGGTPKNMVDGEIGGGDTEVFYDFGEEYTDTAYAHLKAHPNTDSGRFIELCNSVFIEYLKKDGKFEPLENKNVDFGGGLERLVAATNNNPDVFKIDIFDKVISAVGNDYEANPEPYRVVVEHLRSAVFIIAEGVEPSNAEAGYVLRRLIRNAIYNLKYKLKSEKKLTDFVDYFIEVYKDTYPELLRVDIKNIIEKEEDRFVKTLSKGIDVFNKYDKEITGEDAFILQSTYGFPIDLTIKLAADKGIKVSKEEYEKYMKEHKDKSKLGTDQKFKGGIADVNDMTTKYHTATHLLHQALKDVLGDGINQKGSNITNERLRFDFSFERKLTEEEVKKVTDIVNEKISIGMPITHEDLPIEDARKKGAIGLFDYSDIVRVYTVGDYSMEFCNGPHVENTSELGQFEIKKEESVAAGIRRIKAVLK